jgi:hypothetical protein
MEGVAPWPLEAGAELIHGEHSLVRQLTKSDQYGVYMPAKSDEKASFYVYWSDTNELVEEDDVAEAGRIEKVLAQVRTSSPLASPRDQAHSHGTMLLRILLSIGEQLTLAHPSPHNGML